MISHRYEYGPRDVARLLAPTCLAVLGFAGLIHALLGLGWLPAELDAENLDEAIVRHQQAAARRPQAADVLLLGDSSCLMGVRPAELEARLLGHQFRNAGTLSTLGLVAFGDFFRTYAATNRARLRTVVLLVHPEMLLRGATPPKPTVAPPSRARNTARWRQLTELAAERAQVNRRLSHPWFRQATRVLGVTAMKNRLWSRALPPPLPGVYGHTYGFLAGADRYMARHQGCLLGPYAAADLQNQEASTLSRPPSAYRISDTFAESCPPFRAALPDDLRLIVGLTPLPRTSAPVGYAGIAASLLDQLDRLLRPARVLKGLPPTLPNTFFSTPTHLNPDGAREFTARLANELAAALREDPRTKP